MIDISGPKVSIPAGLFALLAPGMIVNLPNSHKLFSLKTSLHAVLFHSMIFLILYRISAAAAGIVLNQTELVVPTILFILLNPGVFITVPPGPGGVWRSGETNVSAIITQALMFAIIFAFIRKTFPLYY